MSTIAAISALAAAIWPSTEWAAGPGGAAFLGLIWWSPPVALVAQAEVRRWALGVATVLAAIGSVACWLDFRDNGSSTAVFVYFLGIVLGTPVAGVLVMHPRFQRT